MSGVKHTPVKLHAVFNGHYWDVAVSPENFSQCVGSCHQNAALGYGLDGAERYARLFAAAPDLLEAAGWADKALERYIDALGVNQQDEAALIALYKIKDAITRARGES